VTDAARTARRRRKAELAMRELAKAGNPKAAADSLGISEATLRRRVADYCTIHGFDTPVQAAYHLGQEAA
jgi:transcriptional regulator with PAS, ATPase and Fis domain